MISVLSKAVQTLAPKLTPEQAQSALGPVLNAIHQTTDHDLLPALVQVVPTLGPTPEQTQAVLDAIGPLALQTVAEAVQALAPQLTPEQALAALSPVLDAAGQITNYDQVQALASAVQSLAPKLTPEQAQTALGPVLDGIPKAINPYQLRALAQAMQTLGSKLKATQIVSAI